MSETILTGVHEDTYHFVRDLGRERFVHREHGDGKKVGFATNESADQHTAAFGIEQVRVRNSVQINLYENKIYS